MKKNYSFNPLSNIGDTVYIIKNKYASSKLIVIKTEIDDIRYFASNGKIQYSTKHSDHFEDMDWFDTIYYGTENFEEIFGYWTAVFINKKDAGKYIQYYYKNYCCWKKKFIEQSSNE